MIALVIMVAELNNGTTTQIKHEPVQFPYLAGQTLHSSIDQASIEINQ